MNNNELKEALLNEQPVIYRRSEGIEAEYKCVSAVIYRKKKGVKDVAVTAEITDMNGNSVTVTKPQQLRFKGAENY